LKTHPTILSLIFFCFSLVTIAQTAQIKGVILDEFNDPIEGVNISSGIEGTQTNENGFYLINIPANQTITIKYTHISHKSISAKFKLNPNEQLEFNPVMKVSVEQISTVIISGNKRKDVEGIITIEPEIIRKIPGANAGIENILMTLPGVSSSNELSTQYAVRGGNFDENLVYVNGIEVYRPFLIRSGQQEGFSFINSDLVSDVEFSAGGFQAKYGDKLSSVLDITYKKPISFGASVDLSLLGANAAIETASKDGKFTSITGLRYRDNSLFVNSKQTETNFKPLFADIQTYLTYQFNPKLELSFLGNASLNRYEYEPQTRQTNFGTLDNPLALIVDYEGGESNRYQTIFGALQGSYNVSEKLNLKLVASSYHTTEEG
jgi:hypothetical protein